jgi:hypothetical protein
MDYALLGPIGLVLGLLICLLVALQCMALFISTMRRSLHTARVRDAEMRLLEVEIDAARRRKMLAGQEAKAWEGWRKFEVKRKAVEARDVCSFYLHAHDKQKLPRFAPGQYLTFQLNIPGQAKSVVRCYSLSDAPMDEYYRVTIKRVPAPKDKPGLPPGLSSNFFHEGIKEGDILDVKAPHGGFYLDVNSNSPVVLIGGGIGITPVLSMLNAVAAISASGGPKRETWFFLGVRDSSEHAFKEHLERIARELDHVKLHVCYSSPGAQDQQGRDYQHAERVSVDLFKRLLPSNNYDYYLCGPGPFMQSITEGLEQWGVPGEKVHFEAFGPASVKKVVATTAPTAAPGEQAFEIVFARSDKRAAWSGACGSILELAEASGVRIDSGCRAGNCGTCITAIKSGKVKYPKQPGIQPEAGTCLACVCVPEGPVVLDA